MLNQILKYADIHIGKLQFMYVCVYFYFILFFNFLQAIVIFGITASYFNFLISIINLLFFFGTFFFFFPDSCIGVDNSWFVCNSTGKGIREQKEKTWRLLNLIEAAMRSIWLSESVYVRSVLTIVSQGKILAIFGQNLERKGNKNGAKLMLRS